MRDELIRDAIISLRDYIPNERIPSLRRQLENVDDNRLDDIITIKLHNPTTVLLLSIFLGGFGVDRFVIGDVGLGVAKLLLSWATGGIWPLIDIFFSHKKAKEINYNNIIAQL